MKADSATNVKNKFSAYLDRAKRGETILILEYGKAVAQLTKVMLDSSKINLESLEREGLVTIPQSPLLDPREFINSRVTLKKGTSLLEALYAEREESL